MGTTRNEKKQQARYMDFDSKRQKEKQKKMQVQFMKKAVATDEMTIDQANALIIQKAKQDNQDLVKSTIQNEKTKEFNQFCRSIVKLSEEVEREVLAGARDGADRSPTLQHRMQTLRKQSSKRNAPQSQQVDKRPTQRTIRPQSAQNHTIYTQLKRQRRLQA